MYFALVEIWISLFHLIVTYRKNNHCFLLFFSFTATGQLRKSSMSFCHLCGLVHPLCRPPAPMTKVNTALEFVSWHGVAWILIFYNSRLHQFEPAQLGERWCHRETTGGAAAPGVRGVGASPLPPGEGRASWGRSGDIRHPCAIMRVGSLTLIAPVLFQRMQMMWSSLFRGARCLSASCQLTTSPTPKLFSSWNQESR